MKKSRGARTIVFPTPVFVVGTYDPDGKANMMAAAWGGICSSRPPSICVSLRAATHTHGSIMERKAFTINIPSEQHAVAADYVGIVSGRDVDKFAVTGLTAVRSSLVDAPYVDEFPVNVECKLSHVVELGLHTLFVGEVMDVKATDAVFNAMNEIDVEKVRPMMFAPDGSHGYYRMGEFIGPAFKIGMDLKE